MPAFHLRYVIQRAGQDGCILVDGDIILLSQMNLLSSETPGKGFTDLENKLMVSGVGWGRMRGRDS